MVYLLDEYDEAKPLLEEGLAIRRELGYRRGIAISLSYLGRVAGALQETEESKKYFYEALKTAMDIRAIPLALDILVGLAMTLTQEGSIEQAINLAQFPLHHPASGQEARDKAQRLLAELAPHLSAELSTQSQAISSQDPQQFETTMATLLAAQRAA